MMISAGEMTTHQVADSTNVGGIGGEDEIRAWRELKYISLIEEISGGDDRVNLTSDDIYIRVPTDLFISSQLQEF